MKIENKKTVILTVIGVLALLISVIGATYAYFTVNTDNKFETPKIEAITGALGNVKLVSTENNLYLNLSREDMMEENADVYYAVTDPNGSPIGTNTGRGFNDILEKIQNGEITSEEFYEELFSRVMPTIGYIEVDGAETYDCDYTFEVTVEGNMKEALTEEDANALMLGLAMFDGEPDFVNNMSNIIGTGYTYDIYSTEFPLEISGTLEDISSANKVYINAMLKLDTGYEQNHLIDKNMKLNIKAKSLSCTANKPLQKLSEYLVDNVSSEELWDMTAEVGIDVMDVQEYRYVGTDPSNYICFGTSDKDTCLNDTDKYMYRIIGVFEDTDGNKHTKLIKKEALNELYSSPASKDEGGFNDTSLYKGLNGIEGGYYTNLFVNNNTYDYMTTSSVWYNKISNWNYTMTNNFAETRNGLNYDYFTVKAMYLHELNRSGKSSETCYYMNGTDADCNIGKWTIENAKIGIMYASDYALSLGNVSLSYISDSNYSTLKTGWMHLSNNDSGAPERSEWTMTQGGNRGDGNMVQWYVDSSGSVGNTGSSQASARPVFYLTSDVKLAKNTGNGTISNPYILSVN